MNLSGGLYLGWAYLRRQRAKTLLLVGSLTLTIVLPSAIGVLVRQAEDHLRARAEATPLILGAPGSALELVFNGLYFSKPDIATIRRGDLRSISEDGLGMAIPLYARYSAREFRIVGTTIDYFRFRNLEIAEGTSLVRLGDCVIGSEVAVREGLKAGDSLVSSPEAVFDLAGVYPLKMRVTGVLRPTGTADDTAVFADIKTTWIIEGLAHGHQDVQEMDATTRLPGGGDNEAGTGVKLNASVVEYTEITEENLDGFHFHGDPDGFPLTGALVVPRDEKAHTILLGRYQQVEEVGLQLVEPGVVMDELFDTVFQIQRFVIAALILVGVAAMAIALLVFLLSNRLRRREFSSLGQIGADPASIRFLIAFEGAFVVLVSAILATGVVAVLPAIAAPLVRLLTQSG